MVVSSDDSTEPDLVLSDCISKVNAQYPNPLASSTASDWMERERTDKLNKLYAVIVGKRVTDKYVRSRPVACEKLERTHFHWFRDYRPFSGHVRRLHSFAPRFVVVILQISHNGIKALQRDYIGC